MAQTQSEHEKQEVREHLAQSLFHLVQAWDRLAKATQHPATQKDTEVAEELREHLNPLSDMTDDIQKLWNLLEGSWSTEDWTAVDWQQWHLAQKNED